MAAARQGSIPLALAPQGPSTHGPMNPPHVVVAGTRRSWSAEEKRAILAEARTTTTSVSEVARRHGLHSSLLFRWRRDARDLEQAASQPTPPPFIPLALPAPAASSPASEVGAGRIEIEVAGGHRVRADVGANPAVLRCVIEALIGR
jgi:transposase